MGKISCTFPYLSTSYPHGHGGPCLPGGDLRSKDAAAVVPLERSHVPRRVQYNNGQRRKCPSPSLCERDLDDSIRLFKGEGRQRRTPVSELNTQQGCILVPVVHLRHSDSLGTAVSERDGAAHTDILPSSIGLFHESQLWK